MDNKKIVITSNIAGLMNAILTIVSTITAVVFAVLAAAFSDIEYMDLEQIEGMSFVLALVSKGVVLLFWIMLVLTIVSLASNAYIYFKNKEIDEQEKKLTLFSGIGSAIALLMGLLSIRGMQAFHAFGQLMNSYAQDPEYFDFNFFDIDLLVSNIETLEVPYLLMRFAIFAVGVITLLLILQRSKQKKNEQSQSKPTSLPIEQEKPALPIEEEIEQVKKENELPELPKIPDSEA